MDMNCSETGKKTEKLADFLQAHSAWHSQSMPGHKRPIRTLDRELMIPEIKAALPAPYLARCLQRNDALTGVQS